MWPELAPADHRRFLEGLNWLDGYALREHAKPFVRCSEPEQVAMLEALDAGSGPGHLFCRLAKSLTASTYYATEIGFKELNKGGRVPASFACKDADHV